MVYDILNDDFVIFFIRYSGYQITGCKCGWKEVREVWANPDFPLNPETDTPWILTRKKLQNAWDIWSGAKSYWQVYIGG